jgi:flavin reductase (DIM6/NTAB) family NADH-FMN oxidoreductase RutF
MAEQTIDQREFRDALGRFATGVTVITARTESGQLIGLTVNSFNSLSLDPAMILWSLSKDAPNVTVFLECEHFAVNILAANQQHLSDQFSASIDDRFTGVDWREGVNGVPLLASCLANFECRNSARYDGGDHHIFVGEVERLQLSEGQPLIFFTGQYCFLGDVGDDKTSTS